MLPLRDTIPSRHTPWMMWTLIAVNVAVFAFEGTLDAPQLNAFFHRFGVVPARFTHPASDALPLAAYTAFVTSLFVHGGWLHLLMNLWTLWIFADNVEDRMGPRRFLGFYLTCGVLAGLVHWASGPTATVPTVGASGAIAGVLGAYVVLYPTARVLTLVPIFFWPLFVEIPALVVLTVWFVAQVYSGSLAAAGPPGTGGVAWWAHVGGFVAGTALHRQFLVRR